MPFLLLLFLTACCMTLKWPQPASPLGLPGAIFCTWAAVTGILSVAAAISTWTKSNLRQDPASRDRIRHRYATFRVCHLFALFATFGLVMYGFGWLWVVQTVCSIGASGPFPGAELVLLSPFLVGLILSWACFYDAERALYESAAPPGCIAPYWKRWAYVGFHIRNNLALILAPVTLLIIEQGLLRQYPELEQDWRFILGAATMLIAVFICMPWILRLVLSLRPMPEGPLRERLLAAMRRLNFRCSNVLLWNTRNGVANAMVVGILPYPRYVLLSDRLVNDLTPEEVEAVFGHEVGHIKHHHMAYYLGFMLVSLTVVTGVCTALANLIASFVPQHASVLETEEWALLPLVGFLGPYIFVVFGFLSRRCERQADIYGCRTVSCGEANCFGHDADVKLMPLGRGLCPTGIVTFISALEKVARLNGISRNRPGWLQSWQHSTIARRVEFLQRMLLDPLVEPRFQRAVRRVKWGLLLGLMATLVVLAVAQEWQTLTQMLGQTQP